VNFSAYVFAEEIIFISIDWAAGVHRSILCSLDQTPAETAWRLVTQSHIPIDRIEVSTYTVPTDFPESDGTLLCNSTTLVLVEAHASNKAGLGYTYADAATAILIRGTLAKTVEGQNALARRRCNEG